MNEYGPNQIEYWNQIVKDGIEYYKAPPAFNENEVGFAIELSRIIKPGHKVVDIGCGHGKWYPLIKKAGGEYLGIDWCEGMIEMAKKRYPDGNFQLVSLFDFQPKETFDIAFEIQVLYAFRLAPAEFITICKRFAKDVYVFEPKYLNNKKVVGNKTGM